MSSELNSASSIRYQSVSEGQAMAVLYLHIVNVRHNRQRHELVPLVDQNSGFQSPYIVHGKYTSETTASARKGV